MDSIINGLNFVIVSSAFVAVMLIVRLLLRKTPKIIIMIMWLLVAVRLICPVIFTSPFGVVPERVIEPTNIIDTDKIVKVHVTDEDPVYRESVYQNQSLSTDLLIKISWGAGVTVMLAAGAISYIRLMRKTSGKIRVEDNIYICDDIDNGFVAGILRPVILIPSSIDQSLRSHVIDHEKMHIRHHDHILKIIAYILLSINWFNPLIWIAFISFSRDVELYCDESVTIDYSRQKKAEYAYALLNMSLGKVNAAMVSFGEADLKKRIMALKSNRRYGVLSYAAGLTVLLSVSFFFMTNSVVRETLYCSEWQYPSSENIYVLYGDYDGSYLVDDLYNHYDYSTVRANINAYLGSNWQDYADSRDDINYWIDSCTLDLGIDHNDSSKSVLTVYTGIIVKNDTIPMRFDFELDGPDYYLKSVSIVSDSDIDSSAGHAIHSLI